MARTPRTETITLAAGADTCVFIPGRVVAIRSCTAVSFEAAFDNDTFTTFFPGGVYPSDDHFDSIRLRDSLGAGCAIVLTIGDDPALDLSISSAAAVLAAIAASLVNIDAHLDPGSVPTLIPLTVVPITPNPPEHLVTPVLYRQLMIQADYDNAGNVYLGFANTVSDVNSFARLSAGESIALPHNVHVWAICDAGVNNVRGYAIS